LIWRNAALSRTGSDTGCSLRIRESPGDTSLTASPLVLVVAPDKDFRRSLEFALEAEGFAVDSYGSMAGAFASSRAEEAGCAVVDDTAIGKWPEVEKEFRHFGRPVVLLSDRIGTMPSLPFTTVLIKPFLGNPLIEAVREVVASGV
jgi:DNA-binding response OmpR family regulator